MCGYEEIQFIFIFHTLMIIIKKDESDETITLCTRDLHIGQIVGIYILVTIKNVGTGLEADFLIIIRTIAIQQTI